MSRGQLRRTRENFPRMKERRRGRDIRRAVDFEISVVWPSVAAFAGSLADALEHVADMYAEAVLGVDLMPWQRLFLAPPDTPLQEMLAAEPLEVSVACGELGEGMCRECEHDHAALDLSCPCCLHLTPDLS